MSRTVESGSSPGRAAGILAGGGLGDLGGPDVRDAGAVAANDAARGDFGEGCAPRVAGDVARGAAEDRQVGHRARLAATRRSPRAGDEGQPRVAAERRHPQRQRRRQARAYRAGPLALRAEHGAATDPARLGSGAIAARHPRARRRRSRSGGAARTRARRPERDGITDIGVIGAARTRARGVPGRPPQAPPGAARARARDAPRGPRFRQDGGPDGVPPVRRPGGGRLAWRSLLFAVNVPRPRQEGAPCPSAGASSSCSASRCGAS